VAGAAGAMCQRGGRRRDRRHLRRGEGERLDALGAPDMALIQLSLRNRWEDIFWFSFFHEAGHVVLHPKKDKKDRSEDILVETSQSTGTRDQPLEDPADRFAARTLIPPPHDRGLASLSLSDVAAFARMLDIAPAIVVGRMQHEGLLPYNRGNSHRRQIKSVR
jgi:HTH-type transcriptional regulator/antitoxin HigA